MNKKNNFFENKTTMIITALFCCILWGSAFPCIKTGYRLFAIQGDDTASQILFAGCRFALAGVLIVLAGSLMQKKFLALTKSSVEKTVKLCIMQTVVQYIFFYIGMANISGVKGSIISAANVFFSILLSCLVFAMEKASPKKIIGCLVGFAGVVIVNLGGGSFGGFSLSGDGAMMLSSLANALAAIMIKAYSKDSDPIMLNAYQFLFGGFILILTGLSCGGALTQFSISGIFLLLYMAFISAGAYTLWSMLLKYNPVSKVTIFGFTNPIFGVILSAIILKEGNVFNLQTLIALAFVCVGIIAVNYEKSERKSKS